MSFFIFSKQARYCYFVEIFINYLPYPPSMGGLNERMVNWLLKKANVEIVGDIIIHDKSFYKDVLTKGSLGFGESYMYGKWDSPHLDVLITKLFNNDLEKNWVLGMGVKSALWFKSTFFNMQNRKYSPELAETHYNAGNYLFESFLDPNMIYTCGYFQNTDDLTQAQLDKINIVGNKLNLQPGDKVLDIGCGWGGTARIISEMFNVEVTGVSDAKEMINYANQNNSSNKVKFIQSDYRDLEGKFNKIYNIGFLEAVGPKNLKSFMEQINNLLYDDGIFFTHTIGSEISINYTDPWIDKYIFPHGVIPSKDQIKEAAFDFFGKERDFEAFGYDYDTTLMNWNKNLNQNWDIIKHHFKDPKVFKRMMNFYLLSSAASFRTKKNDLYHYVFTKLGKVENYKIYRLPKLLVK